MNRPRPRPPHHRGGPPKGPPKGPPAPQRPKRPPAPREEDAPAAETLTLFGRAVSRTTIAQCLTGIVAGTPAIHGTAPDWDRVEVRSGKGTLELSALRRAPDNADGTPAEKSPFTRLQGAMTALTKIARDPNPKTQKKVAEQIQSAEFLVAVSAAPRLKSVPGALDTLRLLVHEMDALVFTGETFEDSRGRVLLSLPGDDDDDE